MDTSHPRRFFLSNVKKRGFGNRKRRNICLGRGITVIFLIVLLVILAFTVFKAKDPVITVDSVALDGLKVRLDIIIRRTVDLNLNVAVNLTEENPNKVGMEYKDSATLLICRGEEVGEVLIPAGKLSADETVHMIIFLTVMADRFMSNPQIFPDVDAGSLPVSTFTKISGKVSIFNIFKFHVTSASNCGFTAFISNCTTSEELGTYKNSL